MVDYGDPALWPETCPLGCEREFVSEAASEAPYRRHRTAGVPRCGMAAALLNASARLRARRQRVRERRERGVTLPPLAPVHDVEDWARLPWPRRCPLGCDDGHTRAHVAFARHVKHDNGMRFLVRSENVWGGDQRVAWCHLARVHAHNEADKEEAEEAAEGEAA